MIGDWRLALVLAAGLSVAAPSAHAQNTQLSIAGFNGAFGNSTVANFDAGFDQAGSNITVTVTSTSGAQSRRARVYISASAATIGSKPISDVQWQRTDLGVWNSLSTSLVLVDEQVMGGTGATWSRNILLRILYPWATTPAEALSGQVRFTLQVVAP